MSNTLNYNLNEESDYIIKYCIDEKSLNSLGTTRVPGLTFV